MVHHSLRGPADSGADDLWYQTSTKIHGDGVSCHRAEQSRIINLQEVVPKSLPDVGVIGAQADIIRSRELIAQMIADLDLFQDPEFQELPSTIDRGSELIRQTFPQVASWLDSGLRAWAVRWLPPPVMSRRAGPRVHRPSRSCDRYSHFATRD